MPAFQIKDSVAFVTGTNKKNGIGRAIVNALVAQGARKVYATARKTDQLTDVVQAHPAGTIVPVALDVTDLSKIENLATDYPDVTLVVNNAGYFGAVSSLDDLQVAQTEIAVNYIAPMAIVKAFSPVLKKSNKATAVANVNSIASLINFPLGGTYSASKAAVHSLTQAQRRDLPSSLVVGVYPGPIDNPKK